MCRSDLHPKADREESPEKYWKVYIGFMDLEKIYGKVNREELWQILRMYDVGGKLFNGIKSVNVNILNCVRVKGCERVF